MIHQNNVTKPLPKFFIFLCVTLSLLKGNKTIKVLEQSQWIEVLYNKYCYIVISLLY